jgi:hypothetical protein
MFNKKSISLDLDALSNCGTPIVANNILSLLIIDILSLLIIDI